MTKILIFGAGGNTGRYICKFALHEGHKVVAFVRDKSRFLAVMKEIVDDVASLEAISIIEGDLTRKVDIQRAIKELSQEDGDVVIQCAGKPKGCALFGGTPFLPEVVKNIVESMREAGLKRVLFQAGAMSADERYKADPDFAMKACMGSCCAPIFCIKGMISDNALTVPYIYQQCDDIEWIVSRPGALVDSVTKNKDNTRLGVAKSEPMSTPFTDLGEWTVKAVFDSTLIHTAPIPGYVDNDMQRMA